MTSVTFRSTIAIGFGIALTLVGCASQATNQHTSGVSRYQGTCVLAGIEEVPATVDATGDSVALVARYRFGNGARADAPPPQLAFQVARARANDLRLHLESHATVLCNPDNDTAGGDAGAIALPPFEGQRGKPL